MGTASAALSVSNDAALLVAHLHADAPEARLAALQRVRALAADADSKGVLCDAGAVEALVGLLSEPHGSTKAYSQGAPGATDPLALAVEALSCMLADDTRSRVCETTLCETTLPIHTNLGDSVANFLPGR